jgi:Winged helix DNA-binding domain
MMACVPDGQVSSRDVAARRFAAQLLTGPPATSAVDVAGRLLAIQGQDPRGARLTIRSRSAGLTASDVTAALTADRSLVITWLNRGTLHLIRSEDYWLLHRLTVRPQHERACLRQIAAAGLTADQAEQGVALIRDALAAEGPLTRPQLRERLAVADIDKDGNAALHLLMRTCQLGLAVRGPVIGAQHAYVLVRDWLGEPPAAADPEAALAELARRYLAGHGPADDRDLAKWAGLTLGDVRRGLTGISAELRERDDGLAELASPPYEPAALPAPKLLGSFDPLLLGWASREQILGSYQQIVTVNGLFRPFALVRGRAAGLWSWLGGRVLLAELGELPVAVTGALAAEARDVRRFLGVEGE